MHYADGQEVRLGDVVTDGSSGEGIVVFSIDTNEYSDNFSEAEWAYLKKGVMVNYEQLGRIYYEGPEPYPELRLISRSISSSTK
jgi:hypothetical protein